MAILLMLIIAAVILLPIIWAEKTMRDMHEIEWAGSHTEALPWGLIIVGSAITVALLVATSGV